MNNERGRRGRRKPHSDIDTPRLIKVREFKDVSHNCSQGWGISSEGRVLGSQIRHESFIEENEETHIIPRKSTTKDQHLELFGKKSLLNKGDIFKGKVGHGRVTSRDKHREFIPEPINTETELKKGQTIELSWTSPLKKDTGGF